MAGEGPSRVDPSARFIDTDSEFDSDSVLESVDSRLTPDTLPVESPPRDVRRVGRREAPKRQQTISDLNLKAVAMAKARARRLKAKQAEAEAQKIEELRPWRPQAKPEGEGSPQPTKARVKRVRPVEQTAAVGVADQAPPAPTSVGPPIEVPASAPAPAPTAKGAAKGRGKGKAVVEPEEPESVADSPEPEVVKEKKKKKRGLNRLLKKML